MSNHKAIDITALAAAILGDEKEDRAVLRKIRGAMETRPEYESAARANGLAP